VRQLHLKFISWAKRELVDTYWLISISAFDFCFRIGFRLTNVSCFQCASFFYCGIAPVLCQESKHYSSLTPSFARFLLVFTWPYVCDILTYLLTYLLITVSCALTPISQSFNRRTYSIIQTEIIALPVTMNCVKALKVIIIIFVYWNDDIKTRINQHLPRRAALTIHRRVKPAKLLPHTAHSDW